MRHAFTAAALVGAVLAFTAPTALAAPSSLKYPAPPGYFECDNGQTIPDSWVGDGYPDCEDGTDELPTNG